MREKYEALDAAIVHCITNNPGITFDPIFYRVKSEVDVVAENTTRKRYRVLDGRLQALRKRGVIHFAVGWWVGAE